MLSAHEILTRTGTVSIEIDTTVTDEITIQKLGSIKINNDIDRGERQISTLTTSYGAVSVDFWDNTTNQGSLFDIIRANATDDIPARLIITTNGVASEFAFTVRKSQISFDERAQVTTVMMVPPVFTNSETIAFINAAPTKKTWDGAGPFGVFDSLRAYDFIVEALKTMAGTHPIEFRGQVTAHDYVNGGDTFRLQQLYDSDALDGTTVDRVHFCFINRTNVLVSDVIARLAALNGALFGFAFGKYYWVPKNNQSTPVTLGVSNLDELKLLPSARAVSGLSVRLVNTTVSTSNILADTTAVLSFSGQGDRVINYGYNLGGNFQLGVWDGVEFQGDAEVASIRSAGGNQPERFLLGPVGLTGAPGAVDAYAAVYGAGGNRIRISVTVNDFYAVKPWDCFQFDTTVPLRYRSRIYRASTMEYDIIRGVTKLQAYSIT